MQTFREFLTERYDFSNGYGLEDLIEAISGYMDEVVAPAAVKAANPVHVTGLDPVEFLNPGGERGADLAAVMKASIEVQEARIAGEVIDRMINVIERQMAGVPPTGDRYCLSPWDNNDLATIRGFVRSFDRRRHDEAVKLPQEPTADEAVLDENHINTLQELLDAVSTLPGVYEQVRAYLIARNIEDPCAELTALRDQVF